MVPISSFEPNSDSLMGWRFDLHHRLDPNSRTLYLGDGRTSFVGEAVGRVAMEVLDVRSGPHSNGHIEDEEEAWKAVVAVTHDRGNTTFYGDRRHVYVSTELGEVRLMFILIFRST